MDVPCRLQHVGIFAQRVAINCYAWQLSATRCTKITTRCSVHGPSTTAVRNTVPRRGASCSYVGVASVRGIPSLVSALLLLSSTLRCYVQVAVFLTSIRALSARFYTASRKASRVPCSVRTHIPPITLTHPAELSRSYLPL